MADLHYKTYENIARAHFKPKADVNLSFETLNQFCDNTRQLCLAVNWFYRSIELMSNIADILYLVKIGYEIAGIFPNIPFTV